MRYRNTQAIASLRLLMALRLNEKDHLEKIIASDLESPPNKSIARARLAELERDDESDLAELEKLNTEPVLISSGRL